MILNDYNTYLIEFLFLPEIILFVFLLIILLFNLILSSMKNRIVKYSVLLKINTYLICLTLIVVISLYLNLLSYEFSFFNFSFISTKYLVLIKLIIIFFTIFLIFFFYNYCKVKQVYQFEFIYLFILSIFSLLITLNINDLILFFLVIEGYNLLIYSVIALRKNSNFSLEASVKYFIYSAVITGVFLFSISLIYSSTGCTNYYDLELFLWFPNSIEFNYLINISFYLFIISFFAKIAIAPFHYWLIDIYEGAPLPLTFFLSFLPKIIYFSIFIRLLTITFNSFYYFWVWLFIIFFLFSFIIGVFGSLYQVRLKKIIIFSTVANSGFFLIPFIINCNYTYILLFYFIIIYSINLIGIFYILLSLVNYTNFLYYKNLVNIKNLFLINPALAISFSIIIFSLAGLPPLAGFFPKFYLLINLIIFDWFYFFLFTIIISSIAFFYYIRITKLIMFSLYKNFIFIKPINEITSLVISSIVIFNIFFILISGDVIYYLFDFIILF